MSSSLSCSLRDLHGAVIPGGVLPTGQSYITHCYSVSSSLSCSPRDLHGVVIARAVLSLVAFVALTLPVPAFAPLTVMSTPTLARPDTLNTYRTLNLKAKADNRNNNKDDNNENSNSNNM